MNFDSLMRRFKRHFLIFPLVYLVKALLRVLVATCRVEIEGLDLFKKSASPKKYILMLWHNRLLILPEVLSVNVPQFIYRAVISKSRDGELLSILVSSYALGRTLRVPHHARHRALVEMINQLKNSQDVIILTPDGPRGPRYRIKPGIAMAAKMSGAHVVPITWSSNRFWQLKTWDKLIIPMPFSRIRVMVGEPIMLAKDSNKTVNEELAILEEALLKLDAEACKAITPDETLWPR
jgi:hypothetical protein